MAKSTKATISMDAGLLAAVDARAEAVGDTRSGFLASLVRQDIEADKRKHEPTRRVTFWLTGTQEQIDRTSFSRAVREEVERPDHDSLRKGAAVLPTGAELHWEAS